MKTTVLVVAALAVAGRDERQTGRPIMRQTRHNSVDMPMRYVRIGQLFDRNPSTMLGL